MKTANDPRRPMFRMAMPPSHTAVLAFFCMSAFAYAEEPSYRLRSRDMGIQAFDLTVTETKRTARTSTLNVPGFHSRTAPASRWLMCVYTDLALKRGANFWTVIYPQPPGEDLIVGFPASETENLVETLGGEFATKEKVGPAPVEKFAVFCGIKPPPGK